MKLVKRISLFTALVITVATVFCGCGFLDISPDISSIEITNGERFTLAVGDSLQLTADVPESALDDLSWTSSNGSVTVDPKGVVTAVEPGKAAVTVSLGEARDTVLIEVVSPGSSVSLDPYENVSREAFYANYTPAKSFSDAYFRSLHGFMSGSLETPDQAPVLSSHRPKRNGQYIRNNQAYYPDKNTYVIVDAYGTEVMRIYRGGGYITLEEVAAYVYAFGDVPANYVESKKTEPENSIWGEYLRLNHSAFSGNTEKYPYEPVLPDISGCGGSLYYYEIDIGTTGTDCDPRYIAKIYNDGQSIVRGAARIVYTRYDKNKNQIIDPNEKYVFYTYNHYNDFVEYLNYYGGWGEMFGNITGGGTISSKTHYAPTPYVPVVRGELPGVAAASYYYDDRRYLEAWIFGQVS